ncbi:MFS transporter [Parabacteroides sp. AM08-6]|uniref:MFS transporter n=1 Tax=Parabacteroides sp. AM08-6 TaxID=2292053 RepID=UPI000F00CDFF|nr:MFS transporter [Parabacteroides sp. AM08-6]RHJ81216.1 MFS transporter [Parabacteroides sp. AM08-6]
MDTLSSNQGCATKIQLSLMMFMQYMLSAVWWVPLAAYLSHTLKLEVYQVSLVLSAMAIGAMASSFIGAIADRYFAAEKILAVLNVLTGVFLLLAAQQTAFPPLMFFVVMAMLCHMPTQSLTSTIAMSHAPSEEFPRIRMFGSVGWVASGIFSIVALHVLKLQAFDTTNLPMYCGACVCLVAALLNLRLPHTPPAVDKSAKISFMDITGFSAFSLMKDKNYRVFMILTFLSIIPFNLYHVYGSMILADEHVQNITVTLNLGQLAEMFFLVITTSILVKSGIKKTLIFGMIALLVRYVAFYFGAETGQQWFYYIGIIVHGLIFGLFYVGGQVYTDNVAPKEMKAQAQGLLFFLVWGIGFLIGTLWNGWLIGLFRDGGKCDWPVLFVISSIFSFVLLILFIFMFKPVSLNKK